MKLNEQILSDCCAELVQLGFGGSVPETIDGMGYAEMTTMAGYFNDAAEYIDPSVVKLVAEFVLNMLDGARKCSEELGLQKGMLESRVERSKAIAIEWTEKLAAFDRGETVYFGYPGGEKIRPVEKREDILGVIKAAQDNIDKGGKWW